MVYNEKNEIRGADKEEKSHNEAFEKELDLISVSSAGYFIFDFIGV